MPFLTLPLTADGALIDLAIALSTPRIDALKAAGLLFPAPVWAKGLIDTGASVSAIGTTIIKSLGLVPSGTAQVYSAASGGASHTYYQYDVCLAFAKPIPTVLHVNIPVIEAKFASHRPRPYDALIGRDILAMCLVFYNGPAGTFTLSF